MSKFQSLESKIRNVLEGASGTGTHVGNITGTDTGQYSSAAGGHKAATSRVNRRDKKVIDDTEESKETRLKTIEDRTKKAKQRQQDAIKMAQTNEDTNKGTEARTKIKNVSRMDDDDPTSVNSKLSKENQIKTKIIDEGKPLMSQPNFGLPSSVINSVKSILEKKDNKMPVGEVNLNPKTDDAVDGTDEKDEKDEKPTKKPKKPDSVDKKEGDDKAVKEEVEFSDEELARLEEIDTEFNEATNSKSAADDFQSTNTGSDITKEETELDEAIKIGSKVKIHAPGKDYHEQVGHVGEIKRGLFKGADKKYVVDYNGGKDAVTLGKTNVKLHKEETELDEARGRPRKNPLPDDQDPDTEGHMHPIMQLHRISQSIEGREAPFTHADGTATKLNRHQARMMVAKHDTLRTTQEKDALARALHANNASMRKAMGSN